MVSKMIVLRLWFMTVFLIGILTGIILDQATGEEYKFNMTKELIGEGVLLQYCIADHKMVIPNITEFCSTRYGGINTPYGEAIK